MKNKRDILYKIVSLFSYISLFPLVNGEVLHCSLELR